MIKVDPYIVDAVERANQKFHDANIDILNIWLKDIVLTGHWWLNLALSILPWIIWFLVRKKESTNRLLLAGFSVLIMSCSLDMLGMSMGLWGYSTKVIPTIPPYFPWDLSLIPVAAMLFYQFKPKMNPYFKALIFSVAGSFILQPLFEWIGCYNPKHWKHYYSFPFIFVIYLIGHHFTKRKHFQEL